MWRDTADELQGELPVISFSPSMFASGMESLRERRREVAVSDSPPLRDERYQTGPPIPQFRSWPI